MKKILNAILLVTGTSIGAGFIALPMSVVNLGLPLTIALILMMYWVAYQSSMMLIDLNFYNKAPLSIVGLSQKYAGRGYLGATVAGFYLFSFSVLTVYFACLSDTLGVVLSLNPKIISLGFAGVLFVLLNLHIDKFSAVNSVIVLVLLVMLAFAVAFIQVGPEQEGQTISLHWHELRIFLPICLTSFVMQGVCPQIYSYLEGNRNSIRLALALGLLLPAIVYIVWTAGVLSSVSTHDGQFFLRMKAHQVTIGELIQFLCTASVHPLLGGVLKWVTLCAVITSAIGFAVGLVQSMRAIVPLSMARFIPCIVPVIVNWIVPNAFVYVLCFSALMAVMFAIVSPYRCIVRQKLPCSFAYHTCLGIGTVVALCEGINLIWG